MARDRAIEVLSEEIPGALEVGDGRAALLPRSDAELADALRIATRLGAPLSAPGAEPRDGAIVIDLRRMADLLAFDPTSHMVHVEAGASVAEVEAALVERGLTLDMETLPELPIGTWLAKGAPGARDLAQDPVDQLVAGLSAVLPDGRLLHVRPAPRRAVGPDLVAAFIGARGRLGIITSVHLVARERGAGTLIAFRFADADAAKSALAFMRGCGVRPSASEIIAGDDGDATLALRIGGRDRLREVRISVARRLASERGGVALDSSEAPAPSGALAIADGRTTRALGEALDPARVLG